MVSLNIVILLLVLISLTALYYFWNSKKSSKSEGYQLYFEALNSLLLGDKETAYTKLKEVVAKDSDHIEAYIHLGDILRERKDHARALTIHKNLLMRTQLPQQFKNRVLQSIANDYVAEEDLQNAIISFEELKSLWKKDSWVEDSLLFLYEKTDTWDKAFESKKKLLKQKNEKDTRILSLYKVQEGLHYVKKGEEHQARVRIRDAFHYDDACVAAYYHLGMSYYREKRIDNAVAEWKNLIAKIPEKAHITFALLGKTFYEAGDFNAMEQIYRDILSKHPKDMETLIALSDILEKKGQVDQAITLCKDALEINPNLIVTHFKLLKYYQHGNNNKDAVEESLKTMEQSFIEQKIYTCNSCHYTSEEPQWRCPECSNWQTFDV